MRKKLVVLTTAAVLGLSGTAVAAVELPGTNNAPGSSDCHTNGKNVPPGANGLCKE